MKTSNVNLKNVLDQLSQDKIDLVVDRALVAGWDESSCHSKSSKSNSNSSSTVNNGGTSGGTSGSVSGGANVGVNLGGSFGLGVG